MKGTSGLRAGQKVKVQVLDGVNNTVTVETSKGRVIEKVPHSNLRCMF